MHYYEDYLEIIEFLPAELKSRLSKISEQDERVQVQLRCLNDKMKTFFALCRKDKSALRDHQYQQLLQEYEKVLSNSENKVKLATQVYDLLDRHMRRLDHDLNRFTIELEADTAGITEILEQRSYMLDRPPSPERPALGQKRTRHAALNHDDLDFDDFSPTHSLRASPLPSNRSLKLSRREKSTAAFTDETDFLDFEDHLTPPSELYTGSGGKPLLPFHLDSKAQRKKTTSGLQQSLLVTESVQDTGTEWLEYVDPNEPRYCLCNQVSYGEMVGCDNAECPIEWFHYGCVGILEPPKGKWYCPQCTIKRKGRKSHT